MTDHRPRPALAAIIVALASVAPASSAQEVPTDGKSWVGHAPAGVRDPNLPPDESAAKEQLTTSPRRSEWVGIKGASTAALKAFIVYPQRETKAGVAILVHEDSGVTDWLRAAADQLAKHGFITVAPDLSTGKAPLPVDEVIAHLNAVREYAMKMPAANAVSQLSESGGAVI